MLRADVPTSNWPQTYGIPLHQISFTYSRMHKYQGPLLQLTIDLWNTTTLHNCNIEASGGQEEYYVRSSWHCHFQMRCTLRQAAPHLQLIIHLWNTTTPKKFWPPLLLLTRDLWNTTTLHQFHIRMYIYQGSPSSNWP